MGLNDRLFAPPAFDAEKIEARQTMLPERLRSLIFRAGDALEQDRLTLAQQIINEALSIAPNQADVLRLRALLLAKFGNIQASMATFEQALRAVPDDALAYWQYARVCEEAGDIVAASRLRKQAVELLPESPLAWGDLGEHLYQYESVEASLGPLECATRLAPDHAPAQLKLGNALVSCGRVDEGVTAIRRALDSEPAFGAAWLSLADVKTASITDNEISQMQKLLQSSELDESERTALEFALAKACEDRGAYREAYVLLVNANARKRRELKRWSAEHFLTQVAVAEEVFSAPHAAVEDPHFGEEVIFIVGLPRSGTTLIERIIGSHSQVKAAGELGELGWLLGEESARLRRRYPEWVPQATAQDWRRLGQRYLDLTAHRRGERRRVTDKMPNNWQAFGAIRAMLPGARIIVCRRNAVENCWSCFKQLFPIGWEFTYDLNDTATFWKAFDRTASAWAQRAPSHIREQSYEGLLATPEEEIRGLLEFCGLPFETACLRFQELPQSVQTLSAAQVRQPLQKDTARAKHYGALLDPLRKALGIAPAARQASG